MRVIVIGAGIVGASIAEALAIRGAEVVALDMRAPGSGASQASAGMLAPFTEARDDERLLSVSLKSLGMFDSFVERLSVAGGRVIEYSRSGTLQVALSDEQGDDLRQLALAIGRYGGESEWLNPQELRHFDPTIAGHARGGLFVHAHGFVGVSGLVQALVDHARFSGATFEHPVEAVLIENRKTGVEVKADGRRYEADAAVVAPGSWARRVRVANVPAFPVRPIRGQLLHLTWPDTEPPRRIIWGPKCYCVPWSDGSLLVGATVEEVGFDERSTVEGVAMLTSAVTELLPQAARATVREVRTGLRPSLPDLLPGIGPIEQAPRVVTAIGHYRHGVLLAPYTAHLVSRYLLDGDEDGAIAWMSPNRLWSSS